MYVTSSNSKFPNYICLIFSKYLLVCFTIVFYYDYYYFLSLFWFELHNQPMGSILKFVYKKLIIPIKE